MMIEGSATPFLHVLRVMLLTGFLACLYAVSVFAQQTDPNASVIVRPGAPGEATRKLPAATRATLLPHTVKDAEFMQGMIMHHAQAVEMTDMIAERTQNKDVRSLGARISHSQVEEMKFMRRWLEARGEKVEMAMADTAGSHSHGHQAAASHQMMMPGMLSVKQVEVLKNSKGAEFDRLFLTGMIQHHEGALVMVKDLFDTRGAGQDAELFNLATDVDTGQRAEIGIMRNMLGEKPVKE